jgi:hypothetical protein
VTPLSKPRRRRRQACEQGEWWKSPTGYCPRAGDSQPHPPGGYEGFRTDEAKTALKNTLDDNGQDGHVFKLGRNGDDLAIGIDAAEEGDEVFDLNGEPVLAVPSELAGELDATIDVEHTNEGARLVLT